MLLYCIAVRNRCSFILHPVSLSLSHTPHGLSGKLLWGTCEDYEIHTLILSRLFLSSTGSKHTLTVVGSPLSSSSHLFSNDNYVIHFKIKIVSRGSLTKYGNWKCGNKNEPELSLWKKARRGGAYVVEGTVSTYRIHLSAIFLYISVYSFLSTIPKNSSGILMSLNVGHGNSVFSLLN